MTLGFDLGTSQVVIWSSARGIVLREPSIIAVDQKDKHIIACGSEARAMWGRAPESIEVIRPIRKGVISDYDYAERMIRQFVRRVCAYKIMKPRAALSVPACVTEVEQRSAVEAISATGVRRVTLMEEAVAAAVGAGLDVTAPRGCMAADIGAGTTDVAVLSLGGVVSSRSVRVGGDDLDNAIVHYLRTEHGLVIGELTAETVKIKLGGASVRDGDPTMRVPGRDAVSGLPALREVHASEIVKAIAEPLAEIFACVQSALESTPPELAGDVMQQGLMLTGGGARLYGLPERLTQLTGVHCEVAEDAEDCVARGTGQALKHAGHLSSGVYDVTQFDRPEDAFGE